MLRERSRALGAFYTPEDLAVRVAGLALEPLPGTPRVLDPACGDGALLAAAARRLLARGLSPAEVAPLLHGIDRDAAALAVARERLRGILGDAAEAVRLRRGDALRQLAGTGVGDGDGRRNPAPNGSAPALKTAFPATESWARPFDAILANPPFLSVKRPYLAPGVRAELRSRFALATGQFDVHGLFLEGCLPRLAPGGRWAFVFPRPVLGNRHLAPLRRLALDRGALDTAVDAGLPFAAAVEAVVLAGGTGRATGAIACLGPRGEALPALPVDEVRALPGEVLPLGASAADLALRRRLAAAGIPLGRLFHGGRGIEAGKRGPGVRPVGTPGAVPVRAGEEVRAHRIDPPGRALDPAAFPPGKWKAPELHRGPKLLVRRVAPGLVAAVDPTDTPALNTLYLLHPRDGDPALPYTAAAALGTEALARYFAVTTAAGDRLFPYVRTADLLELPLPPPGSEALRRLGELGRRLAAGEGSAAAAREAEAWVSGTGTRT
jgi:SAM-dependent methyltransferase